MALRKRFRFIGIIGAVRIRLLYAALQVTKLITRKIATLYRMSFHSKNKDYI